MSAPRGPAPRRLNVLARQVAPEATLGVAQVTGYVALAAVAGAGMHVQKQWNKYGLQKAWEKSIARKGSFTARLDPRRYFAGLVHFWSIWDQRALEAKGDLSKKEMNEKVADLHGRYFEITGDINSPVVKGKHTVKRLPDEAEREGMIVPDVQVTMEELQKHSTAESAWISLDGVVYDVSSWLGRHPGGEKVILKYAGKDVTKPFRAVDHSAVATQIASSYAIGKLAAAA